jgi:hypothetical protein
VVLFTKLLIRRNGDVKPVSIGRFAALNGELYVRYAVAKQAAQFSLLSVFYDERGNPLLKHCVD